MLSKDERLSRTIMFLRLPLIVAVVFIHTQLDSVVIQGISITEKGQFPLHDLYRHIISDELARVAVPLFFFLSGFLFFYHTDFSLAAYGKKLKRRARTLLFPYLFWNIVVLLLTFMTQTLLSSMTSGKSKLLADYDWTDWLNIFWDDGGGMPLCYQFWFIRDLMIVILFSPVIHALVKHSKAVGVALVGAAWLFWGQASVPGFSLTAFFFFSWGAWFSINRRDFATLFEKVRRNSLPLYVVLIVVSTLLWKNDAPGYALAHRTGIVTGIVSVIGWIACGIEKGRLPASPFLAGSAFFVYAYHGMFVALLSKYWMKCVQPVSEMTLLAGYLLIPLAIVLAGIGLYALLRKYVPAFTSWITGGR